MEILPNIRKASSDNLPKMQRYKLDRLNDLRMIIVQWLSRGNLSKVSQITGRNIKYVLDDLPKLLTTGKCKYAEAIDVEAFKASIDEDLPVFINYVSFATTKFDVIAFAHWFLDHEEYWSENARRHFLDALFSAKFMSVTEKLKDPVWTKIFLDPRVIDMAATTPRVSGLQNGTKMIGKIVDILMKWVDRDGDNPVWTTYTDRCANDREAEEARILAKNKTG